MEATYHEYYHHHHHYYYYSEREDASTTAKRVSLVSCFFFLKAVLSVVLWRFYDGDDGDVSQPVPGELFGVHFLAD